MGRVKHARVAYPPDMDFVHKECERCHKTRQMPREHKVCGTCRFTHALSLPRTPRLASLGIVRRRKGLSRQDVASRSGIPYSEVYKHDAQHTKHARKWATLAVATKIARALDVEVEELF